MQALTIPDGIAGRDVCGKAKTGSGKTLAFGIPLLMRVGRGDGKHPRALVLVPTRELAVQVAEVLEPLGVASDRRVAVVYGGADIERQIKKLNRGVDVVIATPGRLIDLVERRAVSVAHIEIVVLDEADRMADMGFLPQVEWVLRRIEGRHQTCCSRPRSTATSTGGEAPSPRPRASTRSPRPGPPSSRWNTVSCRCTRWTR